jgi:hypothetical protein
LPGVIQVLTAADVPGSNRQGVVHKDMPVLATDRVRYSGDALALVIARDRAMLRRAIALVSADIEALPAVFDPLAAMAPDAPQVHDDRPGNLLAQAEIVHGDGAHALARCDVVVQARFSTRAGAWISRPKTACLVRTQAACAWWCPPRRRFGMGSARWACRLSASAHQPAAGWWLAAGRLPCRRLLARQRCTPRGPSNGLEPRGNLRAGYRRHACQV